MIPIKLTNEKVNGTENNWGYRAAEGLVAREAKSGALLLIDTLRCSTLDRKIDKTVYIRDDGSHIAYARHGSGDHRPS